MCEKSKAVEGILDSFFSSNNPDFSQKFKKKNKSPERLVQDAIIKHLKNLGFFVFEIESKAIKTPKKGGGFFFRSAGAKKGTPDILGVSPSGQFVAIEVKAKGKRSTLRDEQRVFLNRVIDNNGFAMVCDSIEYFTEVFSGYQEARNKKYLVKCLPQ